MSIRSKKTKEDKTQETPSGPQARHRKSIHQAVLFLLDQAKMNNRDITREADRHARILTEELKNSGKTAEDPEPAEPAKETPAQAAPAGATEMPNGSTEAPDAAAILRESRRSARFQKRV
jgi:hypothetical protein